MATMTTATASASTVVRPTTQATAARSHLRASSAVDLLLVHQRNNSNRRRRIRHRPLLFLLPLLAVRHHTPPLPSHIRDEDHRSRAVVAVDALSIAPRIVRRGGLPTMTASSSSSLWQSPPSSWSSSSSMMATSDGSQLGGYVATTSSNCAEEGARRSDDDDATRRMTNKTWIIQWRRAAETEQRVGLGSAYPILFSPTFSFYASHDVPSDAAIPTNATGNETFITGGRGQRGTAIRCDSWSSSPPSAQRWRITSSSDRQMSTLDSMMRMPSPSLREHPYRWTMRRRSK